MKYILLIMIILSSQSSLAQGFKSEDAIIAFTEQLIVKLSDLEFEEALNSAKPYWPIPAVEVDALLNQIEQQWPLVENRFGNTLGHEFVKKEVIGQSFIRLYYLQKFANHAVYWQIDAYKPETEWQFSGITFSDQLEILYE